MIKKLTNKDEKFYLYMGALFGSRAVEKQTNDRIYDDDNKEWYLYIVNEKVQAFVSISKNVIKNVYTTEEKYLEKILKKVKKELEITSSIVTNCYTEIYEKCDFQIKQSSDYKNFVMIYSEVEKSKKGEKSA